MATLMRPLQVHWHSLLPLLADRVSCGFPSPAQDYVEQGIDLNDYCIRHPAATYLVQAAGDSMINAGIYPGDLLVVDRSLEATHGRIVIACVNGEMTCKRLELHPVVRLVAENPHYAPLVPGEGTSLEVFGVVTSVVRRLAP
ncbi:translesion error-prone DNA polymerase V autoproteolytic subunit [Oceanimonas sp. CHS3-5]|uniref:translesion error-prone DNA polymerase V autoproteolytic subunit n=1 Tax=Oceanimonas sp. CHS3-5 TaxID=3068186 RepID=UPI00273D7383|nr:translesion error-prone DNA polymerase V autoproteolytic subunit [Oceanimonas sp. CHS3-5]MDP5292462.1 translesion error-prone DNA polymerase V autoproteolytic subunit [Oceanimonas sp. CHS3-5]